MAAELGFEPRQTESESVVLPLHNSAIFHFVPLGSISAGDFYNYNRFFHFVNSFLQFFWESDEIN